MARRIASKFMKECFTQKLKSMAAIPRHYYSSSASAAVKPNVPHSSRRVNFLYLKHTLLCVFFTY